MSSPSARTNAWSLGGHRNHSRSWMNVSDKVRNSGEEKIDHISWIFAEIVGINSSCLIQMKDTHRSTGISRFVSIGWWTS